jgi:hypothetical protein
MTEEDLVKYISKQFNVDYNDVVPFYNFSRDDYALFYASILNSIFDAKENIKVNLVRIMNTGINATYTINLNNDFNHTIAITGFDSFQQVLDNINYMKNCLLNNADTNYKPAYIPKITVDENGIRINNYMAIVHREYEYLKEDLFDSPIGNIDINLQKEIELEF